MPPAATRPPQPTPDAAVRRSPSTARPRRHRLIIVSLVVLGLLAGAAAVLALAIPGDRVVDVIRPDGQVARLVIDLEAGDVAVTPADDLAVTIEGRSGPFGSRSTSTADTSDGVLRIASSCRPIAIRTCGTTVTVSLPDGMALEAWTRAGRIDIDGATGGVDIRTDAGPIQVHDVEGGVRLRSEAGPISGTITSGHIEAMTSAGPISLTVTEAVSRLSATTEVGNVELVVPDAVYVVDAWTSLGRTRIEVDTAGDAPRSIHASSEVGSVTVRSSETSHEGAGS